MKGGRHGAARSGAATWRIVDYVPWRSRLAGKGFAANVAFMVTGTALGQAASIVLAPVLARLYTPDQFGYLSVYTVTTNGADASGRPVPAFSAARTVPVPTYSIPANAPQAAAPKGEAPKEAKKKAPPKPKAEKKPPTAPPQ